MREITEEEESAWSRNAAVGTKLVREAMEERVRRRIERGATGVDLMAIYVGAVVECGRVIGALAQPGGLDVVESCIVAYVRGAIRGLDGPVDEDGSKRGNW